MSRLCHYEETAELEAETSYLSEYLPSSSHLRSRNLGDEGKNKIANKSS